MAIDLAARQSRAPNPSEFSDPSPAGEASTQPWQPGRGIVAGLIGSGITLSRTPAMHEAEGERQGLHLVYKLLDSDRMAGIDLSEILASAERCGFAGVNVTYPYKRQVMALLDEVSDVAARVGAVNTVIFRDGRRIGDNTDCLGFAESFRQGLADVRRESVLLLGAGGAGGAVAHALLDLGFETVLVHDIDHRNASGLVEALRGRGGDRAALVTDLEQAARKADGIVNASPMGMAKLPGLALPAELIEARHFVADIVYFPLETELLRQARQRGCRVLPGSGMALYQAVFAFKLFTGREPDVEAMARTFDSLSHR